MTPCKWKSNKPKTLQISEDHVPNVKNIFNDFFTIHSISSKLFHDGRDRAVGIATRYRVGRSGDPIPVGARLPAPV